MVVGDLFRIIFLRIIIIFIRNIVKGERCATGSEEYISTVCIPYLRDEGEVKWNNCNQVQI